jgi:lipopolysaccharide transport system permease protein
MPAASTAIVDNVTLASKIYFPRLILPLLVVATALYPLAVSVVLLVALTLLLQHDVGVALLWVLPGAALAVAVTAGFGLVLSGLHVFFRDVRYIVQASMVALFYATPVIYSLSTAPSGLRTVLLFGPMTGPIELVRLGTGGADHIWPQAVAVAAGWAVVTTAAGVWLHSRFDRVFVDRL